MYANLCEELKILYNCDMQLAKVLKYALHYQVLNHYQAALQQLSMSVSYLWYLFIHLFIYLFIIQEVVNGTTLWQLSMSVSYLFIWHVPNSNLSHAFIWQGP